MRTLLLASALIFSINLSAQQEGDTTYRRCPVYITDTSTQNNFFLEALPATVKVFRNKGNLTIAVEQRDQFFTMFFRDKKLKDTKYRFKVGARKSNDIEAKYSFRSGTQVSYVNINSGTVETVFDETKNLWRIKINGTMLNMIERSVTHFRVRADFYIK
jgi:hypothetical protein